MPRLSMPRFYLAAMEKNRGGMPGRFDRVIRGIDDVKTTSVQNES